MVAVAVGYLFFKKYSKKILACKAEVTKSVQDNKFWNRVDMRLQYYRTQQARLYPFFVSAFYGFIGTTGFA